MVVAASLGASAPAVAQRQAAPAGEQRFFDWTRQRFPADEYRRRQAAMMQLLRESGGGVLLVPSAEGTSHGETFRQLDDFLYFTGLELPHSLLAFDVGADRTFLFVPKRDARFESVSRPNDFPGRPLGDDPDVVRAAGVDEIMTFDQLSSWLSIWNSGRETFRINAGNADPVEFVSTQPIVDWSPARQLILHLQRLSSSVSIRNAFAEIAQLRMVKSPAEIEVMRQAADLTGRAISATARLVEDGVDERRLQGAFESACKRMGAQRVPFTPIIKSGPNSLWPWRILASHYDRRNRAMREGELVIFDVGCELDHYVSDVGRTFPVSGHFTDEQRTLLLMINDVSAAVLRAVRPGVTLRELQAVADEVIPAAQKRYMQTGFFIGHHLGLGTGDPSLPDEPLRPGMIFTVEPWYYNHDRDVAVFVEDEVLVTIYGGDVLTAGLPREPEALEMMVQGGSGKQ